MKLDDIKKLSDDQLSEKLVELKSDYLEKKLGVLNNTIKDTSLLSKLRKDTARVKTIINERKNK